MEGWGGSNIGWWSTSSSSFTQFFLLHFYLFSELLNGQIKIQRLASLQIINDYYFKRFRLISCSVYIVDTLKDSPSSYSRALEAERCTRVMRVTGDLVVSPGKSSCASVGRTLLKLVLVPLLVRENLLITSWALHCPNIFHLSRFIDNMDSIV